MRIEKALWAVAIACAVLLLPSWLNTKTVTMSGPGGSDIQGWGWQNVASWAGGVAVAALFAGRRNRPHGSLAVVCAVVAIVAFGGAAAEAARTLTDLKGATSPTLYVSRFDSVVRPATGMDRTIVIAAVGALFSLLLLGMWLPPVAERRPG